MKKALVDPNPTAPSAMDERDLAMVERAIAELRSGRPLRFVPQAGQPWLLAPLEGFDPSMLAQATAAGESPLVLLTATRARHLGLDPQGERVVALSAREMGADDLAALANPLHRPQRAVAEWPVSLRPPEGAEAMLELLKAGRLLPAALVSPDSQDAECLSVEEAAVRRFREEAGARLTQVAEAAVPLLDAEGTRIVAFRPADGGREHLAILVGQPDLSGPVLTRLHSECFTGDLLRSLRCDCGDQLRGAIDLMEREGGGILLYLAQEGRGIGLVNKLRAYALQDRGADTLDANEQLGFDADERVYRPAAEMLRQLGVAQVRLLTNNPLKVEALAASGVTVVERVPHSFPANGHNEDYLDTKARRFGHLL
ncbi:GTP cyclohydrolase II [Aquibaculum arenosum]|uniref:GTP cyclohydrolase-2 n=1 Tax=Aquibaculum arenosum TaxID=3032591 RepID=A0ABT5YLF5_9PROT|nr:GTP cyclohydrolase II [Fodinicurvata sp. CAU 1616]MDF2095666.1 GTP cyclohydrolase II [Fodinicurvata sp. CAU 1616]